MILSIVKVNHCGPQSVVVQLIRKCSSTLWCIVKLRLTLCEVMTERLWPQKFEARVQSINSTAGQMN